MRNSILSIAAGLLVAVALQVAGSAGAASASGASTSATTIKVRIHVQGRTLDRRQTVGRGRFTLSGETYTRVGGILSPSGTISDRGTFVDKPTNFLGRSFMRRLRGAKGIIWVAADRRLGNWIILKEWGLPGTGAYAGLHGIGRQRGVYARRIDVTMTGTLSR
jgi:hypothetical protein